MTELNIPKHLAIVMDGNGRWAKKRNLPRVSGHKSGLEAAKRTVEYCAKQGVEYLSLFVFSSENWRRPKDEVSYLLDLFITLLKRDTKKLHEKNVCLKVIGDKSQFSKSLQEHIKQSEELTKDNTGLKLILAADYGGKWDILQAVRNIAKTHQDDAEIEKITYNTIQDNLSTKGIPDPDLFIRTSGEMRISNFFLWQLAYTEMYFTNVLWPDFDEKELAKAFEFFKSRERRFGSTSEQLDAEGGSA